jgi:hypothetical protein
MIVRMIVAPAVSRHDGGRERRADEQDQDGVLEPAREHLEVRRLRVNARHPFCVIRITRTG